MITKPFVPQVTGVYSLCKSRILEREKPKGRPVKSMLSSPIIQRPSQAKKK